MEAIQHGREIQSTVSDKSTLPISPMKISDQISNQDRPDMNINPQFVQFQISLFFVMSMFDSAVEAQPMRKKMTILGDHMPDGGKVWPSGIHMDIHHNTW